MTGERHSLRNRDASKGGDDELSASDFASVFMAKVLFFLCLALL